MERITFYTKEIEKAIDGGLFKQNPAGLYEPAAYILGLGGKRLRAALVLAATELYGGSWVKAMPAALAVEVFHNFSLVHDDIMDEAPLRRGSASVHERWNINTAILSGDVMLVKAYELIQALPAEHLSAVLQTFNRMAAEVCEGQQYDMEFENLPEVGEEQYLKMIELKTSVLIGAALKMGAIIGGAEAEETEQIYQFGTNIGMAFQIQDDLLDAFGDMSKVGKQAGGDILSDKKTLLMIRARQVGHPEMGDAQNYGDTEKIQAFRRIFTESGARSFTENMRDDYFQLALQNLRQLKVEESLKKELEAFANYLVQREK